MCSARIATNEGARRYERHRPENTLLWQIIDEYYPHFPVLMEQQGRSIPLYLQSEFDGDLHCDALDHGFLRVRCEGCHHQRLVAFSCNRREICPSCGARRMAESAAPLVDENMISCFYWRIRNDIEAQIYYPQHSCLFVGGVPDASVCLGGLAYPGCTRR